MYFGSVKFYKHIIYTVIITISILAIIGLISIISLFLPNTDAEAASLDKNNFNNAIIDNTTSDNDAINNNSDHDANSNDLDNNDTENDEIDEASLVFELYPDFVCEEPVIAETTTKTAYLTFDDGPTPNTTSILDILKEYNIKGTFFVVTGANNISNLEILKQITDEGHAIGLHSHSHDYKIIYESLEAFLEDLNTSYNIICEYTGIKPTIIRFPGGSVNEFNTEIYEDITSEVLKRKFRYYDWNVSFEDSQNNITADQIYDNALTGIERNNENDLIILIHDKANNTETLTTLKKVIDVLVSYGYTFGVLDNNVEPITFSYK